jgi:uncharacterized protein (TIGR03435 family)
MRSRFVPVVAIAVLMRNGAPAQSPERFEVASVRATTAAANAGTSVDLFEGGRIRIVNEPVKLLIRQAFRVQDAQIIGAPEWLDTDRFDIEAKTGRPEKIKPAELGPLMQSLLADRFHLQFHRETRELTVGALVEAKGGAKLKPGADGVQNAMNTSGGPHKTDLVGTGVTLEFLAGYVGNRLGRIVVDKTGLTTPYDFKLQWAPDEAPDSPAPPLLNALRDQLGLRLESQKSPVACVVIDRIARPAEN